MRYVAATEWILHITDVKVLFAKRLTRLKWARDSLRGWTLVTSVKKNPLLDGIGFRAGGYFWRLGHLGKISLNFQKREAGASQVVSD